VKVTEPDATPWTKHGSDLRFRRSEKSNTPVGIGESAYEAIRGEVVRSGWNYEIGGVVGGQYRILSSKRLFVAEAVVAAKEIRETSMRIDSDVVASYEARCSDGDLQHEITSRDHSFRRLGDWHSHGPIADSEAVSTGSEQLGAIASRRPRHQSVRRFHRLQEREQQVTGWCSPPITTTIERDFLDRERYVVRPADLELPSIG
jgi:hypothetical protein